MYEIKSKLRMVHEQSAKVEGQVLYLYGGVTDPLLGDPPAPAWGGPPFSREACPNSWVVPLPGAASSEPDRENGLWVCYPFGYAFIRRSRPFRVTIGSGPDEENLLSLIREEKKESDRIAEEGFQWASSRLSTAAGLKKGASRYIMIVLERPSLGLLPKALELSQKVLQEASEEEGEIRPASRRFDPVLLTLKSQEMVWLESDRGLIIAEPKNLEIYRATTLYSLALHHCLEGVETELNRQRQRAFSYSSHTGRAKLRSLAIQPPLEEEAEKIYRRSLILSDLSRRWTDPKGFIPRPSEGASAIYNAFAERYRFEEREENAWDQQEVLQELFDVCWDRISEFKYFFYEVVFEMVIVVILLVDFLWLVFGQ